MKSFAKRVQGIRLLHRDEQGVTFSQRLYRRKRKKGRSKGVLRPVERLVDRALRADEVFFDQLVRRHRKSRDGKRLRWLIDAGPNVAKSGLRAIRHFTR